MIFFAITFFPATFVLPFLLSPHKRGTRITGTALSVHDISICKTSFVTLGPRLRRGDEERGKDSVARNNGDFFNLTLRTLFILYAVSLSMHSFAADPCPLSTDEDPTMIATGDLTAPPRVELSALSPQRRVQEAILAAGTPIRNMLKVVESEGSPPNESYLQTIAQGSFPEGLTSIQEGSLVLMPLYGSVDVLESQSIEVTINPSAIHQSAAFADPITLTYSYEPSEGSITTHWRCVSTAGNKNYSPSWNANPSTSQLDPITRGLGYPFCGCTFSSVEA